MAGMHHTAYATKDLHATVDFYENVLGFPLVHTEVTAQGDGFHRHVFFDTGDGTCIAFFDLHGVGETDDWTTAPTGSNGQPMWVSHVAFAADEAEQQGLRDRAAAHGTAAFDLDHGWCQSVYAIDPNGIMVEFCRDTPGFTPDPAAAHRLLDATP
ncbi:MAG: VOC family protein [Actinomycetota bacterium]